MVYQSRPVIRKLPEPVVSGKRTWLPDGVLSPSSPLERNLRSPKGWKKRELDGIGLGIVAALDKCSGDKQTERVARTANFQVTAPISIGSPRTSDYGGCPEQDELGCSSRCAINSVLGREEAKHRESLRVEVMIGSCCESLAPSVPDEFLNFQVADFLSYCYLCRQRLHGKDIYMYRGEKAFCSMECRYRQITSDEYQEKCGTGASEISSSPYSGQLFFTGIVVS